MYEDGELGFDDPFSKLIDLLVKNCELIFSSLHNRVVYLNAWDLGIRLWVNF